VLFDYKAVSADGRMTYGRLDAINLVDLEMRLKRMHLDLVTGAPIKQRALFGGHKVPRPELINFCFHLEHLTRAGVPILDGLTDLRDSVDHPRFREVMAGLIEGIEGGQTLSQAMSAHPDVFNQVFINLIRAGETSGQLPDVLASLTESLKWEDELVSHTKKLLMYPAFVASIVLSATFFLMIYMVPQLKLFVKNMGQVLPPHTKLLFFVSDLLVAYWYVFLLLPIVGLVVGQAILRSNPLARFRLDSLKLRLPLVGPILKKSFFPALPIPSPCSTLPASRYLNQSARPRTSSAIGWYAKRLNASSCRFAKARTLPGPSRMSACSRHSSSACCVSVKARVGWTRHYSTSAIFTIETSRSRSARRRR
jgi:type IV pilus assembly protein PilC